MNRHTYSSYDAFRNLNNCFDHFFDRDIFYTSDTLYSSYLRTPSASSSGIRHTAISAADGHYRNKVELPGVKKKDLSLTLIQDKVLRLEYSILEMKHTGTVLLATEPVDVTSIKFEDGLLTFDTVPLRLQNPTERKLDIE